jgi:hypothetical protein
MIIDYSDWRPKTSADLPGVNGVIRYLSRDARKTITVAEMQQLHGWGIGTALVYEDQAQRAEDPSLAKADAQLCAAGMQQLGVPHGRPVYVAIDWDIKDYAPGSSLASAKLGPVGDYLHEFETVTAAAGYIMGVYGGYWAVSRAIDAGLTSWTWQAIAWSPVKGGIPQQDHRIRLYQTGMQVLGGNADLNLAGTRDWGQFRHYASTATGAAA